MMELSPKQQSVELIRKAKKILILGHKKPQGDFLGASLALYKMLIDLGKEPELIISDEISAILRFVPFYDVIKKSYQHTPGKILRIKTDKFPVTSMKWQKNEDSVDIILEADKNLKFEYLEVINGAPKPDLIIVLNTPDVEKIDRIYDSSTEIFFEVPVINIDHHAGNDYFGVVNLVDLTATSTSEILVSLFEALGQKINNPDVATCLLTGIIAETQSFRTQSTTPKSLTVAAQLLAAGARQQEIITNLYKKRPMELLKLWGEMLSGINVDPKRRIAWTSVGFADTKNTAIGENDVFDAADELMSNTPEADILLILFEKEKGSVYGKIKAKKGKNILEAAKKLGGDGIPTNSLFCLQDTNIKDAELKALKAIFDSQSDTKEIKDNQGDIWGIVEPKITDLPKAAPKEVAPATEPKKDSTPKVIKNSKPRVGKDPIDSAISSLAQETNKAKSKGFTSIGDVLKYRNGSKVSRLENQIDVFDESEEV